MIAELIERLEKAEGPDREIDQALWEAVTGECTHRNTHFVYLENDERELECSDCGADTYGKDKWSGLTSSLDAALSLVERRGWRPYTLDASIKGRFSWMLASQDQRALTDDEGREYMGTAYASGVHSTPALAVCLALLRALSTEA